jgi:hypothetical protein
LKPADPVEISVSNEGARWAIRHNGGVLGHAGSYEALTIAAGLVRSLEAEGRPVELSEKPRSFSERRWDRAKIS